ncbi:MAG: EAL domain-containing protein [Gammaproteobacteria bacterium]|nr:MAG: EAL domain-containing protein [Gammaproteobacteria bacterium]
MNHVLPCYADQLNLNEDIEELIIQQRYGVEYQPIICIKTGEIIAHEALARFYCADGKSIAPLTVFNQLHDDLTIFSQVEFDLKKLQIDFAPSGYDVFVNLDPHAVKNMVDLKNDPLIQFLIQQKNVVVELIENTNIHDARNCSALHNKLSQHHILTALDDIGASHSLISLDLLTLVDYLKYDRSWFSVLQNEAQQHLFNSLIAFSRQTHKPTILEGVENENMLKIARTFSINYVQGYLYRSLFQYVSP